MHETVTPPNAHQETTPPDSPPLPPRALPTIPRRRIVLLAVLPAALVALVGGAVALLVTYGIGFGGRPDWFVLGGGLLLACVIIMGAGLSGAHEATAIAGRFAVPGQVVARGPDPVRPAAQAAEAHHALSSHRARLPEPRPDAPNLLVHANAAARAADPAPVPFGGEIGDRDQFEVFPNLARRLQSLVHREIKLLDELEDEVEDPDLLKGLFRVDHLATRIRRYAENLGVLGGAISHRQWSRPVSVADVLRSSVAEIEHYSRVKLVPPVEGTIVGHAVVDVVHLISELAENATVFSPPQTRVLLRVQHVTAGLLIEVEDRGLGMTADEREKMNSLLTTPDRTTLAAQLRDGRIGLYVVSVLARRRGIAVQLQNNIYGGIQAVAVLPHALLGSHPDAPQVTSSAPATPPDTELTLPNLPVVFRPAVPAPVVSARPASHPVAEPVAAEPRPVLPKRRRQESLAPELRTPVPSSEGTPLDEHDSGLMAAFQSGVRMAEQSHDGSSPTGNGTAGQARHTSSFAPKEEMHDHGQ
ncbi:MAG TPA: ATP-binding protein [Amycolatopsis sp.]|uniref:sensor histidine kinase n=1 Tax=Amycolatopsis sp. TaxID=37632 RepID=UPI002B477533|nr:ATP-binding protein [Amycolatopsis sp.]HKS46924.1 ATP-binding protein [Amycolatopsis sp.]